MTRLYEQALADSGVTPQQFAILAVMLEEARALTASDLSQRLGMERSAATRALERMETQGWVVTDADRKDRRTHPVRVSRLGRDQFEKGMRGWRRAEGTLRQTMGTEKVDRLWSLLEEVEAATASFDPDRARHR